MATLASLESRRLARVSVASLRASALRSAPQRPPPGRCPAPQQWSPWPRSAAEWPSLDGARQASRGRCPLGAGQAKAAKHKQEQANSRIGRQEQSTSAAAALVCIWFPNFNPMQFVKFLFQFPVTF